MECGAGKIISGVYIGNPMLESICGMWEDKNSKGEAHVVNWVQNKVVKLTPMLLRWEVWKDGQLLRASGAEELGMIGRGEIVVVP